MIIIKILPKIINDMLEISIEKINELHIKQRYWIENNNVKNIVKDVCSYMSKTHFYPENYNIVVSEQELNSLMEELQNLELFNFYLSKIKTKNNIETAYIVLSMFLYDSFWHIYNTDKKLIKNIRLNRK